MKVVFIFWMPGVRGMGRKPRVSLCRNRRTRLPVCGTDEVCLLEPPTQVRRVHPKVRPLTGDRGNLWDTFCLVWPNLELSSGRSRFSPPVTPVEIVRHDSGRHAGPRTHTGDFYVRYVFVESCKVSPLPLPLFLFFFWIYFRVVEPLVYESCVTSLLGLLKSCLHVLLLGFYSPFFSDS